MAPPRKAAKARLFAMVQRQAIGFVKWEAARRKALGRPPGDLTSRRALVRAFDPFRAWAEVVAPLVTLKQWLDLTERCKDAVPDFPGDVLAMFENRFHDLETRDGAPLK